MIKSFEAIEFEWRDTGNVADLNKTRKRVYNIFKTNLMF